jgi:hypothetical protein
MWALFLKARDCDYRVGFMYLSGTVFTMIAGDRQRWLLLAVIVAAILFPCIVAAKLAPRVIFDQKVVFASMPVKSEPADECGVECTPDCPMNCQ